MYRRELYMELKESRACMMVVSKDILLVELAKLEKNVIVERMDSNYRIYYSRGNSAEKKYWNLKISPAARVRYEGGLVGYEKLLDEICAECDNQKTYGVLREGNMKQDFLVIDIYYKMNTN